MGWGTHQAYLTGSSAKSPHVAVGAQIAGHIADETPTGSTYVGVDRLARLTHRPESRTRESIKRLEELGEIAIERRPGRTSLYSIRWEALEWPASVGNGKHDLAGTLAGRRIAAMVGIELPDDDKRAQKEARSDSSHSRGTSEKRAAYQARTAPHTRRAPRRILGDEPLGTPSDKGTPSAPAPLGSPVASALSLGEELKYSIIEACHLDIDDFAPTRMDQEQLNKIEYAASYLYERGIRKADIPGLVDAFRQARPGQEPLPHRLVDDWEDYAPILKAAQGAAKAERWRAAKAKEAADEAAVTALGPAVLRRYRSLPASTKGRRDILEEARRVAAATDLVDAVTAVDHGPDEIL